MCICYAVMAMQSRLAQLNIPARQMIAGDNHWKPYSNHALKINWQVSLVAVKRSVIHETRYPNYTLAMAIMTAVICCPRTTERWLSIIVGLYYSLALYSEPLPLPILNAVTHHFNTPRPRQNGPHLADDVFKSIFMYFHTNFTEICSQGSNQQ